MVDINDNRPPSSEIRPMTAELDSLRDLASRRKKALEDCHIQVAAYKERLAIILAHEADLQRAYDHTATILAPIRRIPDEILCDILREAMPRLDILDDIFLSPLEVPAIWRKRVRLLLVCQRWKRIFQETPSFWSKIIV
ncbi:hypothetical protein M422DRAFT_171013, partial [Sphaerobolus stellatus SS14]